MAQAALLGGLFIGVLSALPVVSLGNYCCCCAWIIGGGVVASYTLQQNSPRPMTPGSGARAGLLAGIVGAFVWLIVTRLVDIAVGPFFDQLVGDFARNASDMPPEARAWLESLARADESGYAGGFALMLLIGSVFSSIGGVIGAAYFRSDVPPALGGPVEPPPL